MTARKVARSVGIALVVIVGAIWASYDIVTLGQYIPYAVVGAFLAIRRPGNLVAWLLIAIGFAIIGTTVPPDIDRAGLEAGTAPPRDFLHAWAGMWAGSAGFLLFATLAAAFPSGRLPAGRTRVAMIAVVVVAIVSIAWPALGSPTFSLSVGATDGATYDVEVVNHLAILPPPPFHALVDDAIPGTVVIFLALVVALLTAVDRYRHADGVVRLQMRWFVAAVAGLVAGLVLGLIGTLMFGEELILVWIPLLLAYFAVPTAVGIAITRYRLFEIDTIISRTIGYAVVTSVLFVVFGVVNLAAQATLGSALGGNAAAIAISTLAVAAAFQPMRRRIQGVVDRRFHRARYDAERTVAGFAGRLRDELDLPSLTFALEHATTDAVAPTTTTVWLRQRSTEASG